MVKNTKWFLFFIAFTLLIGCQLQTNEQANPRDNAATKDRVYSEVWDGTAIIVEERNDNGKYTEVNTIIDGKLVDKIINILSAAEWEENVDVDITPPDYRFTWNSYNHGVWINEYVNRLELIIEGQSNYGKLSEHDSKIFFEMLTGNKFDM